MSADDSALATAPTHLKVGEATVSARVRLLDGHWELIVLINRAPEQPPLATADLQVQMLAEDHSPMPLLSAPQGQVLPEAGGGLGTTANARYRFDAGRGRPAQLVIQWRSTELTFRLLPPSPPVSTPACGA